MKTRIETDGATYMTPETTVTGIRCEGFLCASEGANLPGIHNGDAPCSLFSFEDEW